MDKTACFTGHRPQKLPWGRNEEDMRCRIMKLRLISAVFEAYNRGYRRFISGMADGVDIIAAEAVLKLRENCGDVQLECALPFPRAGRTAQNGARYDRVLSEADDIVTLSGAYHLACMAQRNRYMEIIRRSS